MEKSGGSKVLRSLIGIPFIVSAGWFYWQWAEYWFQQSKITATTAPDSTQVYALTFALFAVGFYILLIPGLPAPRWIKSRILVTLITALVLGAIATGLIILIMAFGVHPAVF
jgi:hypothetical protein